LVLESRNTSLYERHGFKRHGFKIVDTIRVAIERQMTKLDAIVVGAGIAGL
jgi:hypothetical protein